MANIIALNGRRHIAPLPSYLYKEYISSDLWRSRSDEMLAASGGWCAAIPILRVGTFRSDQRHWLMKVLNAIARRMGYQLKQTYGHYARNRAEIERNQKIKDAVYDAEMWYGDECLNEVGGYAIVFSDHVEFVANEKGYGSKLPWQDRKYIGSYDDVRWTFPLSQCEAVKRVADIVFDEHGNKIA